MDDIDIMIYRQEKVNNVLTQLYNDNEHLLCVFDNDTWHAFVIYYIYQDELELLYKFKEIWERCNCEHCSQKRFSMLTHDCVHSMALQSIAKDNIEIIRLVYDLGGRYILSCARDHWSDVEQQPLIIDIAICEDKYHIPQMEDEIAYVYYKTKHEYPQIYAKNKERIDHICEYYNIAPNALQ